MVITSWNVNGIRACERHGLSQWIAQSGADIVCLQEIKAQADQLPQAVRELPYVLIANPAQRPGYSGTAILSREQPIDVTFKLGDPQFDAEGRIVIAQYRTFTLINLYLPHGGRNKENLVYKLRCYDLLLKYLKSRSAEPIVVVGDYNIAHTELDLARPQQNQDGIMFTKEERAQLDALQQVGFIDTFRYLHTSGGSYTWFPYAFNARARNLGWRIDYCFISPSLVPKLETAEILGDVAGSDHLPISVVLKR